MSFYGQIYRRALWPLYEGLRGRRTPGLLRLAERTQWASPEQVRALQWAELKRLFDHAHAQSPWNRARLEQSGLSPARFDSWKDFLKVPLLTKDDIRRHRDEMLAANYRGRVFEHKTGGSTGVPVQFFMTRESYEWRVAVTARGYGWAGAADGEKAFFLWSVPVDNPSRWKRAKTSLQDAFLRHEYFNNFRLSLATLPECVEALNRFSPRVLIGYTSMLEYLARYIRKNGGLRVKLHSVLTAAEGINAAQRELFREVFQAPVFASYGCREFKLIAMECERGSLHVSADNLVVECLRDEQPVAPGEMGEVVVTDLHNFGMPFLRYRLGDVASPGTGPCPCGRGLPALSAVHGRIPDTIQTPDGRLISGIFFPHLLKEFSWIEEFQVIQKQLDHVLVKLVTLDPSAAEREQPQLEQQILRFLGTAVRVEFEYCAEIPRTATGKHRVTVSEIPVKI